MTSKCIDVGPICGGLALDIFRLVSKQIFDVTPQ